MVQGSMPAMNRRSSILQKCLLGVGTTLPCIQWVLRVLSSALKQLGHEAGHDLLLALALRMSGAVPMITLYVRPL
jgi:hypothetical protein